MLSLRHPFFLDDEFMLAPRRNRSPWENGLGLRSQVFDNDKDFTVSVDVPGIKPADLKISVNDGTLTIEGAREIQSTDGKSFEKSNFSRSYQLRNVNFTELKANLHDGVLDVTAPKKEAPEPLKIEVTTGGATPKKIEPSKDETMKE